MLGNILIELRLIDKESNTSIMMASYIFTERKGLDSGKYWTEFYYG